MTTRDEDGLALHAVIPPRVPGGVNHTWPWARLVSPGPPCQSGIMPSPDDLTSRVAAARR
ncbi:hypothetical protein ND748_27230 [Frankia sp. AiPs1]|uniref:hypothetical protein n=1 Tax=Frankia sp. AiPs1 TaxID=573493 RepID=UPI002042D14F|nr:hypothetical protein [Frankia sp. AiPs1]MCM3925347.1 hypothetical protein [Frankia sp. AiPs1]